MDNLWLNVAVALLVASLTWGLQRAVANIWFHPLSRFSGPKLACASTKWRAFQEVVLQRSFHEILIDLHKQYGPVVRVGPNELHFSNPQAYHDIYRNQNRWDKEYNLYHSFGEDRSSFGFLTYVEAKERKDALNKMFSAKAIGEAEGLVRDKVDELCETLQAPAKSGETVDLSYAYRCMTMDVISFLCYGRSLEALRAPRYRAPILVAMDASLPVFVVFKHSEMYKNMIMNCPPTISKILSPQTAGLVDLQQVGVSKEPVPKQLDINPLKIIRGQIEDLTENPEHLQNLPHNKTIYHQLLDKQAYKHGDVPSAGSIYEEAQALMFGGADTTGNTLMYITFHLLRQPAIYKCLHDEILEHWPRLDAPPALRDLENWTYLNAVIKEGLRMSSGVVSGLLRIVPKSGATIADVFVPENTIVSCTSLTVHYNAELFPSPYEFRPERWIKDPKLDNWLVAFSRGPRSCLGINLAWAELRLCLASVFRRYDMKLDPST